MLVGASAVMLTLLGSKQYFRSRNCLRELSEAQRIALPLVRLHEADRSKNGAPLEVLREACPEEHRDFLFDGDVVAWHRKSEFQLVSMTQIAQRLLLALPIYSDGVELIVQGGLAWADMHFVATAVPIYVSVHNQSAMGEIGRAHV